MQQEVLSSWLLSCLLLGLRISPVFALAPPFTLTRIPRLVRLLLGLGLSVCLVSVHQDRMILPNTEFASIVGAAIREVALGMMFVLILQLAFSGLYIAGRTIDIQAGFGIAMLIDPSTRSQVPLVGTIFVLATAALFFATDGHLDLLRLISASLDPIPLGSWAMPDSPGRVISFLTRMSGLALAVVGGAMVMLFLVDTAISFLSRTVPQMNVLVLGFQIKTLVLLFILPVSLGLGGTLMLRIINVALEALPRLI